MVAREDGAVRVSNDPWDDPSAEPFISIEGLSKWFGDVKAVNAVDLDIYQGELFAILGSSGCGKSTLLRMLAGFEAPTSGRMIIDGVEMIIQEGLRISSQLEARAWDETVHAEESGWTRKQLTGAQSTSGVEAFLDHQTEGPAAELSRRE